MHLVIYGVVTIIQKRQSDRIDITWVHLFRTGVPFLVCKNHRFGLLGKSDNVVFQRRAGIQNLHQKSKFMSLLFGSIEKKHQNKKLDRKKVLSSIK